MLRHVISAMLTTLSPAEALNVAVNEDDVPLRRNPTPGGPTPPLCAAGHPTGEQPRDASAADRPGHVPNGVLEPLAP